MTKSEVRQKIFLSRNTLCGRDEKNKKIIDVLTSCDFYKNAKSVMTYISHGGEVDTGSLILKMTKDKKRLSAPKCIDDETICACAFSGEDDLVIGAYGIKEPTGDVVSDIDLIIVPGVAFNEHLHRIGYGKGYYDRFLKKHKYAIFVGLFYEMQKADFKEEENDIALSYVITEEKIYKKRD